MDIYSFTNGLRWMLAPGFRPRGQDLGTEFEAEHFGEIAGVFVGKAKLPVSMVACARSSGRRRVGEGEAVASDY